MRPGKAAGNADDAASGALLPVGGPQACEGRHYISACGIMNAGGILVALAGGGQHIQLIPKPLNRRTGNKDTALKGIFHMVFKTYGNGGDKPVLAFYGRASRIHQQETSGSIGVFHLAGFKAALTEHGALLVTGGTGDGNFTLKKLKVRRAVDTAGRLDLRQQTFRDVQQLQQLLGLLVGQSQDASP